MQTHECKDFKIDYDLTVYDKKATSFYFRCTECNKIDSVPDIVNRDNTVDRTDPGYWIDNY
jgi:hypothetical protein